MEVEDVTIECLHPEPKFTSGERNGHSTVLDISYGRYSMLLTGDISSEEEKLLAEQIENKEESRDNAYNYTILKVPHHGSKYSSSENFLESVSPGYSIISCGKENSYGHPHGETLDRLKNVGSKIVRVDTSGQVEVHTDGFNMDIATIISSRR